MNNLKIPPPTTRRVGHSPAVIPERGQIAQVSWSPGHITLQHISIILAVNLNLPSWIILICKFLFFFFPFLGIFLRSPRQDLYLINSE